MTCTFPHATLQVGVSKVQLEFPELSTIAPMLQRGLLLPRAGPILVLLGLPGFSALGRVSSSQEVGEHVLRPSLAATAAGQATTPGEIPFWDHKEKAAPIHALF